MMIYYTREGQSLIDLCDELQIENPEYLRKYHQKNYFLPEQPDSILVSGMKVYIPSSPEIRKINGEIRYENKSLYDFPVNGKYPFDFRLCKGSYHMSQVMYSDDTPVAKYESNISLDFEGVEKGFYHFHFSVYDFIKNDVPSETKAAALTEMCMKSIYPLEYIVTPDGQLIDVKLTKKVGGILSELEVVKDFFPDQYSSDYIENIRSIVRSPEIISQRYKNTLFSSFMFGAFYRSRLGNWTTSGLYHDCFPWIFDAQPIRFEFRNKLFPKNDLDDQWLKIHQKGRSSDHRSLEDLYLTDSEFNDNAVLTKESVDCEHIAEYIFSREDLSLRKVTARFQNFLCDNIKSEDFLLQRITPDPSI